MPLVLIESPNKISKLRTILGPNYTVMASVGHIMDLSKKNMGVDLDTFEAIYKVNLDKKDIAKNIKAEAKKHEVIYIATDPDREGEAIAFHIASLLPKRGVKIHRVRFNAITKEAVKKAMKNPEKLDQNLYDAQQARRITDRLVGFRVSPVMWNKGLRGTSAGRVQSVALKFVADREKEIKAFVPKEYWTINAETSSGFSADFYGIDGKNFVPSNKVESDDVTDEMKSKKTDLVVTEYVAKQRTRKPYPPFITSTMQQSASNSLGWGAKKTMSVAQSLFGYGLITYHRCFPGHVRISTSAGMVPIKDIKLGEMVDTLRGPRPVTDIVKNKNREIYSLQTKHGYMLEGSHNEPLLVMGEDLSTSWVKMEDLKPGDHVALAKNFSWSDEQLFDYECPFERERSQVNTLTCAICGRDDLKSLSPHLKRHHKLSGPEYLKQYDKKLLDVSLVNNFKIPKIMTNELARVLGYLSSEGTFSKNGKNIIFYNSNKSLLDDFANCFNSLFGTSYKPFYASNKFEANSQRIWNFLNWLGLEPVDAKKKRVPQIMNTAPKSCAIQFLKSYWEGDGSYDKFITDSLLMARDLKLLLLRIGIPTGLHISCDTNGFSAGNPQYLIQLTGYVRRNFFAQIQMPHSEAKRDQAEKMLLGTTDGKYEYHWSDRIPHTKGLIESIYSENFKSGWSGSDLDKYRVKIGIDSRWNRKYGSLHRNQVNDSSWGYINFGKEKEHNKPSGLTPIQFIKLIDENLGDVISKTLEDDIIWDKITKVKTSHYEDTWDLTVEGQHHYVAEGFYAHNTDSTRSDPQKITDLRAKITKDHGKKYLSPSVIKYGAKSGAQDAHEAIRPTYDKAVSALSTDEKKLLRLIDNRFTASQMANAKFDQVALKMEFKGKGRAFNFKKNGSALKFDGFLKVYGEIKDDVILPSLAVGDKVPWDKVVSGQHFTKPPPRFSDASIIKLLEKEGVGRPSTYASILDTILNRKYVTRNKKALCATETGIMVSDYLTANFSKIVDAKFTSKMESNLDTIATGGLSYKDLLKDFNEKLDEQLKTANQAGPPKAFIVDVGCPKCKSKMTKKISKSGPFLSCLTWPKCDGTASIDGKPKAVAVETGHKCPECSNILVKRKSKAKGTEFLGCKTFPTCRYAASIDSDGNPVKKSAKAPLKKTGQKCPKCKQGDVVERKGRYGLFAGCSKFPKCKQTMKI